MLTLPRAARSAHRSYRSMHDASSLNKLYGAVIKVYATVVPPNYFLPWTKKPQREATGSGFMIKGNRILTNAHVVAGERLGRQLACLSELHWQCSALHARRLQVRCSLLAWG